MATFLERVLESSVQIQAALLERRRRRSQLHRRHPKQKLRQLTDPYRIRSRYLEKPRRLFSSTILKNRARRNAKQNSSNPPSYELWRSMAIWRRWNSRSHQVVGFLHFSTRSSLHLLQRKPKSKRPCKTWDPWRNHDLLNRIQRRPVLRFQGLVWAKNSVIAA